jgi:ABC-type lipoprotein export system ATPase subunit
VISVKNVTKIYKHGSESLPVTAVADVNMEIQRGEFANIMGRSGSGKTTLLSMIGGLTKPTQGNVFIDNVDVWSLDDRKLSTLRNQKVGFIFQFSSLIPTIDVFDNLMLPAVFSKVKYGVPERALELLEKVELDDKVDAYPSQLSSGEQRRIAIARALMSKPDIVLADEPTGDLDEDTEEEIMKLLQKINSEGATLILVTHNPDLTKYSNRIFKMSQGRVKELPPSSG